MVITDMAPALSLPPWRPLLSAARRREGRAPGDRWLQLATLALDGSPRVRTLVFRDWSGESEMDLLSDARSEKCLEIVRTPMVEVCWLFRKARVQFRLRGTAKLMSPSKDPVVLSHLWNRLTPSGQSVWAWPHPGMPLQEEGPWVRSCLMEQMCPSMFGWSVFELIALSSLISSIILTYVACGPRYELAGAKAQPLTLFVKLP